MTQISLFDGDKPLKITKPIRLIELFAGYGSQSLALKYLGVPFEHWKIAEWAVKSIQAYKDMHFGNDNIDYSKAYNVEQLIDILYDKSISNDYNSPMTREQIKRMGEQKIRTVYNNIVATNNLVSVCNVHGQDLEITDTDKYTYVMTYSFPCQDLSKAGKTMGMAKGSGTRSGMLWEVERMLDELYNGGGEKALPQILIMENVPDVIGSNNIKHFAQWVKKLEQIGYTSKWQCLNGKNYGVPQNRDRCFMVSWLGNYYYDFPQPIKLEKRLKDILETNVDNKYYLSDIKITQINQWKAHQKPLEHILGDFDISPCITARGAGEEHSGMILYGMLGGKFEKMHEQSRRVYDTNGIAPTMHTCAGGNLEPKIAEPNRFYEQAFETAKQNECKIGDTIDAFNQKTNDSGISPAVTTCPEGFKTAILVIDEPTAYDEQNSIIRKDGTIGTLTTDGSSPKHNNRVIIKEQQEYSIRKLTPRECFRLMGVKDDDFDKVEKNQSNSSLYHLAGDSLLTTVIGAIFCNMIETPISFEEMVNSLYKSPTK